MVRGPGRDGLRSSAGEALRLHQCRLSAGDVEGLRGAVGFGAEGGRHMQVKLRTFVPSWAPAVTIDKRWFIGAGLLLKGKERHAAYGATARHCRVFSHTVTRWMPSRLQIEVTLSPLARAVRIASTSVSVSCVRERLAGFNTTPDSGSAVRGPSLPTPRFACSHAELSRSSRFHVFGLSPPASTT